MKIEDLKGQEYTNAGGHSVILHGTQGCGKTAFVESFYEVLSGYIVVDNLHLLSKPKLNKVTKPFFATIKQKYESYWGGGVKVTKIEKANVKSRGKTWGIEIQNKGAQ